MADNVTLGTMSGGDTIGADDIAGVKYQRVKLIEGADGSNDGDVSSANPLPVDTELPAAAALADAASNPTTPTVGSAMLVYNGTTWDRVKGNTTGLIIQGAVAHDAANSGNPLQLGAHALAYGANPTAVAAADLSRLYTNRHGILHVIGGHINTITKEFKFADADGAQSNVALITVSGGEKIAVTGIDVTADNANTVDVDVRVGLAAATLSAISTSGVTGIVASHPGIAAGSGIVKGNGTGIIAVGADGEDLRITCEDPVTGSIRVVVTYFTIES